MGADRARGGAREAADRTGAKVSEAAVSEFSIKKKKIEDKMNRDGSAKPCSNHHKSRHTSFQHNMLSPELVPVVFFEFRFHASNTVIDSVVQAALCQQCRITDG